MAARGVKGLDKRYDCIVIGGGLGGLTCANRLARADRKVLLLEHHTQLGGLATWFRRKNHIFDVALHGFPVGMIKTVRKYWSKDISDRIVQLKGVRFDNPQFKLQTTYSRDDFTRLLIDHFKVPADTVEAFFTHTRSMNFFDDDGRSIRELFEEFFPGRDDVVRLLMEPITYANGSTLDDPAISYGIVFSNFMSKGVFTFIGGTDLFIGLLEEELRKNGVEVRTRALVENILYDGGKVTGVVANGVTIEADSVVSNANLKSTILDMLDPAAVSDEFRARVAPVRINNSSCQVYFGIRQGEKIEPMGDLVFTSTAEKFDAELMLKKDPVTSRTYSVYYPEMRPGHNRYTIVASSNARYDDWTGMSEEEYQEDKQKLADSTLDHLSTYIPNIRDIVDHVEVATPRTFKRYTLHQEGSSFGTKFEGLPISTKLHEEVPGLFHTGSVAIIMSGWLGAANYGVIVANEVDKYLAAT